MTKLNEDINYLMKIAEYFDRFPTEEVSDRIEEIANRMFAVGTAHNEYEDEDLTVPFGFTNAEIGHMINMLGRLKMSPSASNYAIRITESIVSKMRRSFREKKPENPFSSYEIALMEHLVHQYAIKIEKDTLQVTIDKMRDPFGWRKE